ncbi:Mbeg1-like protein [Amedibacillus sp. YH-ame6]
MLNEKTFYDVSLLSYFDCYEIGESVADFIDYILQDEQLRKDYESMIDFSCNLQMVENIQRDLYETMYVKECFNDNAQSGVVYYVFECEEALIFAIRGSEALDHVHQTCGWEDWMDNFRMFLKNPTYQQVLTLHHIQNTTIDKPFYLCGHSKGGNLALFCALTMKDALEEKLMGVCSFNAPGITRSILSVYQRRAKDPQFLKKLTIFENENDTISSFFEHLKEPNYIKSCYPCNNLIQLYHNHNLYAMDFEENLYLLAEKKTGMPKLVYHFVNDFFVNLKQERLESIVHHMDDYFMSGLSMNELYKVLIYHISKYTSLFEDISYEEVGNISFQDLIDRRKTKLLTAKIKDLQPMDSISKMATELKANNPIAKLNEIDVKEVTLGIIENYELLMKEKAKDIQNFVVENNEKIIQAIKSIRNRETPSEIEQEAEELE